MIYFRSMVKYVLLACLMVSFGLLAQKETVTILIDPGHGGSDPGHLPYSDSLKQEKELTLEISKKLGAYLEHNMSNVKVIYTRTDDSYPTLDERVDMANNKNVDLMLSIHCNGSDNHEACGTETHIHNRDAKKSYKYARLMESQFKSRAGRRSRGVKTIDDLGHSLQVLKYTKMPAVLIECGFLTHLQEGKYLNTEYGQEIIASAIFRTTRDYLNWAYPTISFVPEITDEVEEQIAEDDGSSATETENTSVQPPASKEPYYMVQIMATIDSISTKSPEFKSVEMEVHQKCIESQSMYRYKYYVGPYATKKEAKQGQKAVSASGFEDAFLVFFEE